MSSPLVSVITVVYNDVEHIEATIQNVLSQTFADMEYIVVDGDSTDGTLDVVKKYDNRIRWISEKDGGIYDAMMKGARMAKGEWLIFRNSGDYFFDETSIEKVFANYEDHGESIIAGGIRFFSEYGYKDNTPNIQRYSYFDAVPFDHPATFVRRSAQLKYPFHLEYRNSADYCCFLEILLNGGTYYISDAMIALMDCSRGATAEHYDRSFEDNIVILTKLGAPKRSIDKQRNGLRRYRISAILRQCNLFVAFHNRYRFWKEGFKRCRG